MGLDMTHQITEFFKQNTFLLDFINGLNEY